MTTAQLDAGRYELLRLIGAGAFSTVYEARDPATGEHLALKRLSGVGPPSLSSFKREFRTLQGVHHPNLVELRELFEVDGVWFIAMELIDGEDLISHLRHGRAAAFDASEVHHVFGQLVAGLAALHAQGVVHRDLKPRNVMVTPEGRVVLLDFGLVKLMHAGDAGGGGGPAGLGTAEYMAPEQAVGGEVGPAADLYAVGVCLYQALAGCTPFAGCTPREIMLRKPLESPASPASYNPALPAELVALCMRLLEIEASRRPTGAEVLRALCGQSNSETELPAPLTSTEEIGGRESELEALGLAFARSCGGEFTLVLVEGESGIGKSALVAAFMQRLQRLNPDALILRSRCYENELIAYKAFDAAMEQLARALVGLDAATCASLLPERAPLLTRLFGVFATVEAIAQAPARGVPADPAAQRLASFGTLCQLLSAVARRWRLVIEIDDLQWADQESFRLLRALAEDAGRPAALVIATSRVRSELTDQAATALAPLRAWHCTRTLALPGLARTDAANLAVRLLGGVADQALIDTLVSESGGHPLLLSELVRYATTHARTTKQRITLDYALRARIEALGPRAVQLISAVAVAGRPYPARVFARATGLGQAELDAIAGELLAAKLLRRRAGHELACFHDRIRIVAETLVDPGQRSSLHAQLAGALAAYPQSDPGELARHHDAAGQVSEAIAAYARAATHALSSLAFARAEQLCARALALAASGVTVVAPPLLEQLMQTRGDALARAGRSAEAAQQFQDAAQHATGKSKIRLRILAAQHLLQSAHVTEGLAAARALLHELDVPMPSTTAGTLVRLAWDRTCLQLSASRGATAPTGAAPDTDMQLDALWGLAQPVTWFDSLAGIGLATTYLRRARALGQADHTTRALAEEAFARALGNRHTPEALSLLKRARALSEASGDATLELCVSFREGAVALVRWDLPRARERLQHAQRVGAESCPEQPWLNTNVRVSLAAALALSGEHAKLIESCAVWLAEARDRSDQFALSLIESLGGGYYRHMMADAPQQSRLALDAALDPWPRESFTFAHFGELIAVVETELYRGGDGAYRWLERELPRLSRAFLLRMPFGKAYLLKLRVYAIFAARAGASAQVAQTLLREAHTHIVRLERLEPTAEVVAQRAQLSALQGDCERALAETRRAHLECDRSGFASLAHTLGYFEGMLEGGALGAQKQRASLAFFAGQGWLNPRRAVAIRCPAADELEARGV